jgi:hypothetical protein
VKTARFSKVVEKCGDPETYLLLMDPAKDRTFQAGLKAQRVMTVFQEAVGTKTDRGEVGFQPGRGRQFLVFPKSLTPFAGERSLALNTSSSVRPKSPKASERNLRARRKSRSRNLRGRRAKKRSSRHRSTMSSPLSPHRKRRMKTMRTLKSPS